MSEYHEKNNKQLSQPNLLFYMEGCKTCNVFITGAHQANILKNFKMICIDGQKDKFKAQGLKRVPTIIIPSINKQFDGNDCIKWLEDMIKLSSRNNNVGMQNEELYIPDVGIVSTHPTHPNHTTKLTQPTHPTHSNNQNYPIPPSQASMYNNYNNSTNHQISQLSNQISQLSTQINNSIPKPPNQFEVPKTNIIKRTTFNPVQPPLNSNGKNINLIPLNNQNPNMNNNMNNNTNNQPMVRPINQLFGYLQNEMSGLSDGYAYVNVDNPLPKSFLPPDKDMEIYTAPEGDKIDKKRQDQMIQLAEMERKNEKDFFKNQIDEVNKKIAMGDKNLMPKWIGSNKDL